MAEFRVTSAELRRKADELKNLNSQFKSKVGELVNNEGSLVSMWEGPARDAFHNAFNSDKAQWDNFYSLIEQYIIALNNNAAEYDSKEALNVNIASRRNY